jgi:Ca2+-binding EF-hand superfamily protein
VRLTRYHLYLLVGLMVAIVGPAVFSQPDPNWGGRGKGKMGGDPDAFWNMISQGKETIDINNIQLPGRMAFMADRLRERWNTFLQSKGVNDGIMTKSLFQEYQQQAQSERQARGGGPGGWGKGGAGDPNAPHLDPKAEDAKIDEEAKQYFATLDRNKDGFLDREEAFASQALRDFARYDKNRDGKISLDEYREAYRDQQAERGRGTRAAENNAILMPGAEAPPEEDKRPVVYRAGKLPKDLPSWFAELDKDNDGQVGLYEWKAGGRTTSEFLAMDANGDGFLTVEEVLRHQKVLNKDKTSTGDKAVAGGPNGPPGGGPGRFGQFGWGGAAMPGGGMPGMGWGPRGGMGWGPGGGRGMRGFGGPGGARGFGGPGGDRGDRGGRGRRGDRGGVPGGFPNQ